MSKTGPLLSLPSENPAVIEFLKNRRSNLVKIMAEPGPDKIQLNEILTIGARVPDHRKLEPWRFLIFKGDAREKAGQHLARIFRRDNPDLPCERAAFEAERLTRAPLVIAVISAPVLCPRGTPKWEQTLSAGAVCYNLCLAAQALGFAAQWLTEWYAYDPEIRKIFGLTEDENFAGFIHIGSAKEPPTPRKRPDLSHKCSLWLE